MIKLLLPIILFLFLFLFLFPKLCPKNKDDNDQNSQSTSQLMNNPNIFSEKNYKKCARLSCFKTGYINEPRHRISNQCGSDVLYPVNPPYVDYGEKDSCNCPANKFNEFI